MILVDTSVWIGYLRGEKNLAVGWFREILDHDLPFGLTWPIYQEILQGADSEKSFERLDEYLATQVFFETVEPETTYREAARLYYECRRTGFTIRSTIDCLIARVAIERDLDLLHADRDFEFIASADSRLRIYTGLGAGSAPSLEVQEEPRRYG